MEGQILTSAEQMDVVAVQEMVGQKRLRAARRSVPHLPADPIATMQAALQ